jgi:phage terminase small subunit
MPKNLSTKQRAFAEHYAVNNNATAAYKAAGYTVGKTDGITTKRACRMVANREIYAAIQEIRKGRIIDDVYDRAWLRQQMMERYQECVQNGDAVNARGFLDMMNKTEQQYVEKHEVAMSGIKFNISK